MRQNKGIAMFLVLCIMLTLFTATAVPVSATVSVSDKGSITQNAATNAAIKIYFGKKADGNTPALYRVVAKDSHTMTLFYDGDNITNSAMQYDGSGEHKYWKDSYICQWLNGSNFLEDSSVFTNAEREAITVYGDEEIAEIINGVSIYVNQKAVLPSMEEVKDGGTWNMNATVRSDVEGWWLRTPDSSTRSAVVVRTHGAIDVQITFKPYNIRPTFKIDLESVLLTSNASGAGVKSNTESPTLSGVSTPAGLQKLTLIDSSLSLGGVTQTAITGNALTLAYAGATPGKKLSAIVENSSGAVTHYGMLVTSTAVTGTAVVNLPSGFDSSTMKLKVFVEQINGDGITDYASEPVDVIVDNTPPIVSSVSPTGSNTPVSGNVVITFNEAMNTSFGGVALTKGTETKPLTGGSWSGNNKIYTIAYSSLARSSNYTVNISGFQDIFDFTMLPDNTHTFTTVSSDDGGGGGGGGGGAVTTGPDADKAKDDISKAKEGDTVNVPMNDGTKLPASILDAVKGKDINVVLDFGNYSWTFNGKSVGSFSGNSIDLGTKTINISHLFDLSQLPGMVGANGVLQLEIAYSGALPFDAILDYPVGTKYNGKSLHLYYYNDKTGVLEFKHSAEVEKGRVKLNFNHASQYVLTLERVDIEAPSLINPFTDVKTTHWFYDAVMGVYEKGLFGGTGETTFSPQTPMTRAMFATVLARLEDVELSGYEESPFSDVDITSWYGRSVTWAADKGIIKGYGVGAGGKQAFKPNDSITREEMTTMLYRYIQYKGDGFKGTWTFMLDYDDRDQICEWAYEGVCYLTMKGIIQGNESNLFNPEGTATRAEVATLFMNYLNATEK